MILPSPKEFEALSGSLTLPFSLSIQLDEVFQDRISRLIPLFFPDSQVSFVERNALIVAEQKDTLDSEEYSLLAEDNRVLLRFSDYLGLRNALASLSQMASATKEGWEIPCAKISDQPLLQHRGVMLDLARGIRPFETLIADMALIAQMKINVLHLHLADSRGICFRAESLPEGCWLDNAYTKDQIREIVSLCDVLGFLIIPEFDAPAHAKRLVANIPELACEVPNCTNWTVCAGAEKSYEIYEAVIHEICELIPSPFFHVGGDELDFLLNPELRQTCHWDDCPRCRKKMEEENLTDRQDLYYYVMLRVYEMVKKEGRTMIMWSDQIDCTRPCPLPRDVIMHFWRVAAKGRGPWEGCSFNEQLKMGYTAINSYFKETYVDTDHYLLPEKICDWRWYTRPEAEEEYRSQIMGCEMCAWEYGNAIRYPHYDRTFAPSLVLWADRLWHERELVLDDAYEEKLTRAVLGAHTPKGFRLFHCFGSLIPPRTEEMAFYDRVTATTEELEGVISDLVELKPTDHGSSYRIKTYILALLVVLDKKKHPDPKPEDATEE